MITDYRCLFAILSIYGTFQLEIDVLYVYIYTNLQLLLSIILAMRYTYIVFRMRALYHPVVDDVEEKGLSL